MESGAEIAGDGAPVECRSEAIYPGALGNPATLAFRTVQQWRGV